MLCMHRVQQVRRYCTVQFTVSVSICSPRLHPRSSVEKKSPKGHTYVIEARTEKSNEKDPQVCVCFEGKERKRRKACTDSEREKGPQQAMKFIIQTHPSQLHRTIISSIIFNTASNKMFRALAILASIVGGEFNALFAF